ncbi:tRNA (adenosine(37)-N6)-dimethylallyltransferase MiaA [Sphingobacterium psychroaquaticum]|uniref:tRNA dimethylallyltransferase n=1 Tax=Sphingobacterium psychroaquaticum TaxID=561061 RepID=A0A1X7L6J0_9SPHI|nr:tRNA (adenosine(37)-N6)-dimethylallyltransferase MiaA [Sphingobacterium psychroaquaticum]QBQ42318.1 tRNA (adenosine(37)-N6)-dimethylallyltransferase MiaA [Sphingobacterium psychroaquaticum]SMG49207.1 tRNA dimethylallyltransferase [Sphingobacterium psychroaquaticum]
MAENKKTLIVVVGPTAVGKTAMGIALAQHFQTEIISADSRQFYKEMTIGTAKPDALELAAAKHHFIDSHSIEDEYSAGDFERDALSLLETLFEQHDVVVMVGGSGLFVRAVCEGLDNLPKAPVEVRERLNARLANEGINVLQEALKEVDPVYYATADIHNPQRVIRALEVFEATGQPISSFQVSGGADRTFNTITIGLNMPREALYERINLRVDKMIDAGLVEEVKRLFAYKEKPALLTVGYAEIFDYLDGHISLEEAVEKIKQNTRRYAKRQITWFKKYGNTTWFEPNDQEGILTHLVTQM